MASPQHRMLVRHAARVGRAGGHSRGMRTARVPLLLLIVLLVVKGVLLLHLLHLLLMRAVSSVQQRLQNRRSEACHKLHWESALQLYK